MEKCTRKDHPTTTLTTLAKISSDFFPNIWNLLHILATLPVTIATGERSFSTLWRLKTYLKNNMVQTKLTGLALQTHLNIYRNFYVSIDNVINRFARLKQKSNKM